MTRRIGVLDAVIATKGRARLVARPTGVAHVYVSELTPGGLVPRHRRPVCRAHTARLRAVTFLGDRLVCARCSARLVSPAQVRAEQPLLRSVTREDDRRRYAGLSVVDIYLSTRFAVTLAELDECSIALALTHPPDVAAAEYTSPTGRVFRNLPQIIDACRERLREKPKLLKPHDRKAYLTAAREFETREKLIRQQAYRRAQNRRFYA